VSIKSPRDFWCGLLFLAIGVTFMVLARDYRMGSAARMGPGYFPIWLGGTLAVLGAAIAAASLGGQGAPFPRLHLRPLLTILAGIVVFGLALEPLGFVIAVALLIGVSGFADPRPRPREIAGLALFMVAFSVGIFVVLLGLPLTLWPNL
jgi:putative tricarboxylic transport membrane protein